MQTYIIHLTSVDDLKKYVSFLENFPFCGYITVRGFRIDAGEVLQLFHYCPAEQIHLHIDACLPEEKVPIRQFLLNMGLSVTA